LGVGAAAVVGVEDPIHDLEKVTQTTRAQGMLDGVLAVPLAQLVAFDVRVSDIV
jgi:hypothetical protein